PDRRGDGGVAVVVGRPGGDRVVAGRHVLPVVGVRRAGVGAEQRVALVEVDLGHGAVGVRGGRLDRDGGGSGERLPGARRGERDRRRVVALLIAAGDAVDGERLRRRVAAAPGAVEADGGAGAGAQVAVPRHALGGHPGAGLAPGGAPALLQALAGGREVEGERPLVQRVTAVLDGDRGGEPAAGAVAPVVGGVGHLTCDGRVGRRLGEYGGGARDEDQDRGRG